MRFLYFVISSGILIGLVLLVRKIFRKQIAPGMLYALWLLPLLRLLMPFGFFEMPVFGTAAQLLSVPYAAVSEAGNILAQWTGESEALYRKEPGLKSAEEAAEAKLQNSTPEKDQGEFLENNGQKEMKDGALEGNSPSLAFQTEETGVSKITGTGLVLSMIWICGSVFLGIYAACSNCRLKRGIRHMETADIDSPLPVKVSDAVVSPCLFGLFRPCILVNPIVTEEPSLCRYVLEHEMAHYRQKDHIWTFLRVLLRVIYWWNPLVWIGTSCAAEDAELSCDAAVIRGMDASDRKAYGYSLLRILKHAQRGRQGLCAATSMSGNRRSLRRRMEGIAEGTKTKKQVLLPVCLLLAAVTLYGCGMPSGKSWMKAETEDRSLMESPVDYELSLQDEIRSRLFYYEIYHYGELTERAVMACGELEKEDRSGFRAGLTLLSEESGENEKLVFTVTENTGANAELPIDGMTEDHEEAYADMLRGRSVLWDDGKKQEVKAGDDLILMADYYQASEKDSLTVLSCEVLTEEKNKNLAGELADTFETVLIHMVLSDQPGEKLFEQCAQMEYPQKSEDSDTASGSAEKFVRSWADGFVDRDGRLLLQMMSDEVKQKMMEEMWFEVDEEEDFVYFGWSSPWPMFGDGERYRILEEDGQRAEILYYASDSSPHIYVWRETLEYEQKGDSFQVVSESMEDLSSIESAEEFYRAYPDGEITGTMMDYQANGLGAYLNEHALEEVNDDYYSRFLDAKKSALELLNIAEWENGVSQDISDKVSVSAEDMEGMTTVQITFLQDGSTVEVSMLKPYGEDGIWIPGTASDAE